MKLFRNCPNDSRKNCEDCPLLKQCIIKKMKRKINRFRNRNADIIQLIIILVFSVISLIGFTVLAYVVSTNDTVKAKGYNMDNVATKEINENVKVNSTYLISHAKLSTVQEKPSEKQKNRKVEKVAKVSKLSKASKTKSSTHFNKVSKKYAEINAQDRKMMEKMVYAESRGEPYEGQVAVAAVILNRYKFNNKKQSIKKILTAKYQFADISNITEDMLREYPSCKKAVKEALEGNDPTKEKFSEGARYFYQPELVSEHQKEIRQGIKVLKIGNHLFHNDFKE